MKQLITRDPKILGGKPIIAGTRMSVEVILEFLAGGMEIKEILKEFPILKKTQVQAAIEYAAKTVSKTKNYNLNRNIKESYPQIILNEIHRRH